MNDSYLLSGNNQEISPNNFSAQEIFTVNSNDVITINLDPSVLNNLSSITSYTTSDQYVISDTSLNTNWTFLEEIPFVDAFPAWSDFSAMKTAYPSLDKAFENLKQIYDLCKDDWKTLKDESK